MQTAQRRRESQYVDFDRIEFRQAAKLTVHNQSWCRTDNREFPGSELRISPHANIGPVLTWVIVGSFFGFVLLAFLLLYPVYRFLRKEAQRNRDEEV